MFLSPYCVPCSRLSVLFIIFLMICRGKSVSSHPSATLNRARVLIFCCCSCRSPNKKKERSRAQRTCASRYTSVVDKALCVHFLHPRSRPETSYVPSFCRRMVTQYTKQTRKTTAFYMIEGIMAREKKPTSSIVMRYREGKCQPIKIHVLHPKRTLAASRKARSRRCTSAPSMLPEER